ncbi:MAG TPA: hypothetical protein DEA99_04440 [Candidatus Omnitrophica bacterium]|nr:hypothetical protein [Candidatus Omnitrophota bacterium]
MANNTIKKPAIKKPAAKKVVAFKCTAPSAKRVCLAGSFNNWDAGFLSAKKDAKGNWAVKINLDPGRYEYKFVVDGSWINDPNCKETAANNLGSANSVLVVK